MKKYTITEQEWENVISKIGELENESNKLKGYIEALEKKLALTDVVQQSEQYCECEKPTLGKSVSRCGTCDEWFKPLK